MKAEGKGHRSEKVVRVSNWELRRRRWVGQSEEPELT